MYAINVPSGDHTPLFAQGGDQPLRHAVKADQVQAVILLRRDGAKEQLAAVELRLRAPALLADFVVRAAAKATRAAAVPVGDPEDAVAGGHRKVLVVGRPARGPAPASK